MTAKHLKPKTLNLATKNGQVMLLTVMVISGTLLSITISASLLMLYQIKQAGNFANTSQAFFASDSGLSWWYYNDKGYSPAVLSSSIAFNNGAKFEISTTPEGYIKIVGQAGNSKRALSIQPLTSATCNSTPDVMLAVDRSRSINFVPGAEALYKQSLSYAIDVLSSSTQDQAYFGMYALNPSWPMPFNNIFSHLSNNSSSIETKINGLNFSNGNDLLDLAATIDTVNLELSDTSSSVLLGHPPFHDRNDSTNNPDFILVITDTLPNSPPFPNPLISASSSATAAKGVGTKIAVIGIDPDPPNGAAWHNYFANSIASPGFYVSSTGVGSAAYGGNLKLAILQAITNWILACP